MLPRMAALLGVASFVVTAGAHAAPASAPRVGASSIGGTVTSTAGPEAGVWVVAETAELGNRFVKIVVTDEQGRFVLPDLPQASYKIWSRGYGLNDSEVMESVPGKTLTLKATVAANGVQAARIYPANYWASLIHVPPANDFPGTGPRGNGISPAFKTQEDWITHLIENCQVCHQLGTKATRELPEGLDHVAAWDQRVQRERSPDDVFFEDDKTHLKRNYGVRMSNLMTLFGRQRGLDTFADWSTRIAKGEVPPAPSRPTGIERNAVVTMWDIAGGRFLHDSSSSDRRNPTVNAGGLVYGFAQFSGMVVGVDPKTGKQEEIKLTDRNGNDFKNANNHTGTLDAKGRIWMTNTAHLGGLGPTSQGPNPTYCTDPKNKFAAFFPRGAEEARIASMLDPKTKKSAVLPICFGTHHLNFDKNERLYFSGDTEVVGWVDVKTWDKTQDVSQAVGWCPMVLDTSGDGRVTPDRTQWNLQLEGIGGGEGSGLRVADDAAKSGTAEKSRDTRIAGFTYGIGISPKDQTYWAAKYSPYIPSGILRVDPGARPPLTCKTEYYEAPRPNGKLLAFNARGVDVDEDGIVWVAFGTGSLGRFDRSKCKVLNGPTATGQHCPEGWEIIDTPGPKFAGTNVGSDWFYLVFVDRHNTLGLGKNVPVFPNSSGDELLAYLPKEKKFVHLRVPYPLGFYARGVDGRIDDAKTGWKGRGLWATNNVIPIWHQETGEGSSEVMAHFQMRPTPLAE